MSSYEVKCIEEEYVIYSMQLLNVAATSFNAEGFDEERHSAVFISV